MKAGSSPSGLRQILGALALVASLLALKSLIWPRWPSVAPLDRQAVASQLRAAGFRADSLPSLPARRSYERSTSEGLGFNLGDGQTLRLLRGRVRERLDLQGARLAASDPSLVLQKRELLAGPPPSALGRNGESMVRQSCLVSGPSGGGGFGMTDKQLLALVDQLPSDRLQQIKVLIGASPPREYGCVLISVLSRPGGEPMPAPRWQTLQQAMRQAVWPLRHGAGPADPGP